MIPPLLHFIWINRKPFSELEYLSLKSAIENTNYKIFFHTDLKPGQAGRLCPYTLASERVTIFYNEHHCSYKGIQIRASSYTELLRIQLLHQYGGIYSDLDMVWFAPIPFDLQNVKLLAPWQNQSYKLIGTYILGSEKGYDFTELQSKLDEKFDHLTKKNITVFEGKSLKDYLLFNICLAHYFRDNADLHLKRKYFEKNTWKNIWRFLHNEIPEEKIVLKDICGIHICGCQLFGKYKCNTSLLLEKHSKLKALCNKWLPPKID